MTSILRVLTLAYTGLMLGCTAHPQIPEENQPLKSGAYCRSSMSTLLDPPKTFGAPPENSLEIKVQKELDGTRSFNVVANRTPAGKVAAHLATLNGDSFWMSDEAARQPVTFRVAGNAADIWRAIEQMGNLRRDAQKSKKSYISSREYALKYLMAKETSSRLYRLSRAVDEESFTTYLCHSGLLTPHGDVYIADKTLILTDVKDAHSHLETLLSKMDLLEPSPPTKLQTKEYNLPDLEEQRSAK